MDQTNASPAVGETPQEVIAEKWYWHAFHEQVAGRLGMSYEDRVDEIVTTKPEVEIYRRLRLFRPAQIPVSLIPMIDSFSRSTQIWQLSGVDPRVSQLHQEQCADKQGELGCPWDDKKQTIFPEYGVYSYNAGTDELTYTQWRDLGYESAPELK